MAFLTLDDWTMKVRAQDNTIIQELIGDEDRMFSGDFARSVREYKQRWNLTSIPLAIEEATALIGLLNGKGDQWKFDEATVANALYSGKHLGPLASPTAVAGLRAGFAADGTEVVNETKFIDSSDAGVLTVDEGTTNESAVGDTDGDHGNWSGTDASFSTSSSHYHIGSGSVLVDIAVGAGTRGAARRVLDTDAPATTDHAVSFYAKLVTLGGGGETDIRTTLTDTTNSVNGATVVTTLTLNKWTRIEAFVTTGATGSANIELVIEEDTVDSALDFAVDTIQLEQKDYATTFVAPGTRAAGRLDYNGSFMQQAQAGGTFAAWVSDTEANGDTTPSTVSLATSTDSNNYYQWLGRNTNSNVRFVSSTADGSTELEYVVAKDGDWHHVATVWRRSPADGTTHLEIYYDGISVATGTVPAANTPDFTTFDRLYVCYRGTANTDYRTTPIDDLRVLPYPAHADQIAAWAARSTSLPNMPAIEAAGDFYEGTTIDVMGIVNRTDIVPQDDGLGNWLNNKRRIGFTLREI